MKFNQDLIAKARKGEIAILNDGSVEELNKVLSEVWPGVGKANGTGKYYFKNRNMPKDWSSDDCCYNTESHSVKDFFMPDTKDTPIFRKENEGQQPRTYRVTRQQMHEIYSEAMGSSGGHAKIMEITSLRFGVWENEANLFDDDLEEISSILPQSPLIKSIFPSYFFIPEGEPVLYRDTPGWKWVIGLSDGNGGIRVEVDGDSFQYNQIIPFTKNPPK